MIMLISIILLSLPLLSMSQARPWSANDIQAAVDLVPQSSPLLKTIDSMSNTFTKSVKTAQPTLTPILSIASIAYIGYVGSGMLFPKVLKDNGVPILADFKIEARNVKPTEANGLLDSLATGFVKDMIAKTEAADVLRNTSLVAVTSGLGTLKRTTRIVNKGLESFQDLMRKISTALSPECLSRTMCQVGQFTSWHMPSLGPFLRSINTVDLDDYSQALIDGTTVGDCSAVYHECPL